MVDQLRCALKAKNIIIEQLTCLCVVCRVVDQLRCALKAKNIIIELLICLCVVCRVVDQLRCALKAKNIIIEQLEEEKRDAVSEASHQCEMMMAELKDKLRAFETTAAADVSCSRVVNTGDMFCSKMGFLWQ